MTKELATPDTSDDFEEMCHQLYRQMWNDSSTMRVGRPGQAQFGVDILGYDGRQQVGIQCKHYPKKRFTFATVLADVAKADENSAPIGHLLFATTVANDAEVVRQVVELSIARRAEAKFTVSVDFWSDICGHIKMHPSVGRTYIPGYPGGTILDIRDKTNQIFDAVQEVAGMVKLALPSSSAGMESDARVAKTLDLVRDKIRDGKSNDANELLNNLGDPAEFVDDFSRFRWHTNRAAVHLANDERVMAAEACLTAYELAPANEVANVNKVRAYLLLADYAKAQQALESAIHLFPESSTLWSLKINIDEKQGIANPLECVPISVRESHDVLLMRAEICHNREEYAEAINLLKRAIELEPGLLEAKRAYLSEALSWAAKDKVQASYRHLLLEKTAALEEALSYFEPLEKVLPAIQSDAVSFEVTSNVSAALMLLGKKDRARAIVALCLDRHPLSDGLLRIRLVQLAEQQDFAAMRQLTDSRLWELHPVLLAHLAEVSANKGDLAWYDKVMEVVSSKVSQDVPLGELRAMRFQAMAVAGKIDEALVSAKIYAQENPNQVLAQVVITEILERKGEKESAREAALAALACIRDDATPADLLQVAELLYQFHHFNEAAPLFERLVSSPGADSLTWKLLVSLLKADSRAKVRDILNRLSPSACDEPEIRRIECDLARRAGDWAQVKNLLQREMFEEESSSDIALGYVGALYQLSDVESLRALLSKDPVFTPTVLENEYEYAKHQVRMGLEELAMKRMYRVYRFDSSNTRTASHYLAISLMCKDLSKLMKAAIAGPGTAIELRSGEETWWVAIDHQDFAQERGGWPELITHDSEIAITVSGLKIGDRVRLNRGFLPQECEIVGLISIVAFAGRKAHAQIAASATPQGPIFTITLPTLMESSNVNAIKKQREIQEIQRTTTLNGYREIGLPFCVLAGLLDTDPVALLVDWSHYKIPLAVHSGMAVERAQERLVLHGFASPYVLDLVTLAELIRSNVLKATIALLGKPLIPSSMREHILRLLNAEDLPQTAYSPKSANTQSSGKYSGSHKALLNELLRVVDNDCELAPTYGPREITEALNELKTVLDRSTMDAMLLCLERNALFITEDFNLRVSLRENGVTTVGTQVLMINLKERQRLSQYQYAAVISRKIQEGHWFVNVSADELVHWCLASKSQVNPLALAAIKKMEHPNSDLPSCYQVCAEFLLRAANELSPKVVALYVTLIFRSLSRGRSSDEVTALDKAIRALLRNLYGPGGSKLARSTRAKFGNFI